MWIHVHVYIYTSSFTSTSIYIFIYVYIDIDIYICIYIHMYTYMYLQIVLDSIAALARKEGLNEVDKEQFIIGQVSIRMLYDKILLTVAVAMILTIKSIEGAVWNI